MRIIATTAFTLAMSAWLVAPLAPVAADPEKASGDCTIVGTPGDDVLRGTKKDDFICGLGGDDRIKGRGGDDVLRGGQGDDIVEGGPGDDVLSGGRGDDHLDAQDLATDRDRLRCGRGEDTTVADVRDRVRRDCENVDQDNTAPTDLALTPASVAENRPAGTSVGTLTATDADAGDEHTFALVAGAGSADNGSFSIVGATVRTAAPLDHETTPTLSIRVRATDTLGLTVEKQVTVTVTDVDDPAVAVDDAKTVVEDDPATAIDVLANDTDTDGGPKDVASVTQPAHGTVVITGGGTGLTYAPAANYCNTPTPPFDTFTYTLNGGDVGAVHVTVTCVDDLANAVDDSKTVAEDSGATTISVLGNDTDPEGDAFAVTGVGPAGHGTTSFTASDVSYTPAGNYCGPDTFAYTITGGDTATVSVTVTCANDAPVAVDDTKAATEDTPLTFPAGDLTGNDTDPDVGDTLTVTAVSGAAGGTATLVSGSITFTPTANLCLPTSAGFDYTVSDGTATDSGHVTVDVACVDDPAVAADDTRTVNEDASSTGFLVLVNDSDPEGDPFSILSVTDPAHGSVTFNATSVAYTPDPDYCNTPSSPADTFDYTITGGDTATVSVTVTCVNDAPVADLNGAAGGTGSSATFNESNPHTGPGVLIAPNATVTDVDDTTIESATITLTNHPDGAAESLTYTIPGGSGISVVGSGYDPVTGVLAFTGSGSKADYSALIASITYDNTTNPPTATNRLVNVTVNDGDVDSATATATVQVVPINAPPVNTVPGGQTTDEDTSKPISGISVADADNPASLTVQLDVTHGTVTVNAAGLTSATGNGTGSATLVGSIAALNTALATLIYTPASNYNGPAQLTIATTDGLATDTDNIALTVTAVNDQPSATNLSAGETYTEDATKNLVAIVVSDVDSTNVTASLALSTPTAGSLSTGTSGTVTSTYVAGTGVWAASGPIADVNTLLAGVIFTPAANFNASFTIATSVTDGVAAPATGSKAMTGTAVNDAPTVTAPASGVVDEDTDLVFTGGNVVSVADVDAGASSVQVTLTTTNGTMTLSGTAGLTVTGQGTGLLAASGTIANLNTALASSKFRGTLNYNGPASVAVDISDLGNTPAPPLTASKVVAVTVNPVNDAPVADDETFNGANSAIGNTTLVVDDPTDGAPSAAGPRKTITGDILAGDTDVDGDTLSVVPGTISSGGGTVVMEADGDFTLLPPAGCAASYSFDYTITDGGTPALTDTGTVTVAVTECVWYVDPAAAPGGDGRSSSPFQTLTPVNGAGGAGDVDDDSDYLFVQAGSYGTGLVLESNQRLFGQPHGLTVAATTLVASGGGSNPTISSSSGNGLTLSTGNNVQGVNLGTTPAGNAALTGTTVGTTTMNTVTPGSINNAIGGAVDISGGTLAMAFTSVSSSGATGDAIRLDNTGGTFTASGGALQNAGGQDVDLSGNNAGDDVTFTYDGTITDDQGQLVNVSNQSGGTKDFNGAITDGNDGDGAGISLTANTGATVRFDAGLTLSTGGNTAFSASGGGTVVVTDPNAAGTAPDNTLATTTGTALNVANTTIGANGLTFRSTSSNGAANGIVLNNTGSSGGLTVTGNGGTCSSVGTCSGGAIQASTGSGISLTNVGAAVSLTRLAVSGSADDGITGNTVNGLSLTSSVILNNGNSTIDRGLDLFDLTGSGGLASSTVSGSAETNVRIENNTSTALTAFNVTASTIANTSMVTGDDGVLVLNDGAGAMNVTVNGSAFTDNKGDHFQAASDADASGSINATFSNNTLTTTLGNDPNVVGGGITINTSGTLDINFTVSGNNIQQAFDDAINLNLDPGSQIGSNFVGTITGNTIGTTGVVDSGSESSNAVTFAAKGAGTATVAITNNVIRQFANLYGIAVTATEGSPVVNATVTGNTVKEPGTFALNGIRVDAGATAGPPVDASTLCVGLSGNDVTGSAKSPPTDTDIRLRQRFSTTIRLPGYSGANTDTSAVNSFVSTNNTGAPTVSSAQNVGGGGGGFVGGAACTLPS